MAYNEHLDAFVKLGTLFNRFSNSETIESDDWLAEFNDMLSRAEIENKWYTRDNLAFALGHWGKMLTEKKLREWLAAYSNTALVPSKTVAIIMAGNIPLVGFHDFLCVVLSGYRVLAKLSSNDKVLLPFVVKFLCAQDPSLTEKIKFTEDRLEDFDAVIATGSNNTSRYFDYYFKKYPSIIRKNRNSIAILDGEETPEDLTRLGEDIFRYFGLGCRSVSKIYVPKGYRFESFFESIFDWKHLLNHHKYVNNYDYNKAVYLMSALQIFDNGFLVLKEDKGKASPIATLFYEEYNTLQELSKKLLNETEEVQCIVSNSIPNTIGFGTSQIPSLSDYADNVDTMEFLVKL